MIKSIFYSRFHPSQGPIVLHQVPDGAIVPSKIGRHSPSSVSPTRDCGEAIQQPLVDFSSISDYIIPRQELCNTLVTICSNHSRIIGFPVCIVDPEKYARNEFIFNFALVVDENADKAQWEGVVKKLARVGRSMEEESHFLSQEEEELGLGIGVSIADLNRNREFVQASSKVYALCEMIMEDLNNYCECMIPIDDTNTLNLKLFPTYPDPPPIRPYHVPLLTVNITTLTSPNWDLTVLRIIPFIDGVNSVSHIARLADADLTLSCKAIAHLVYYGCILLLDVFRFDACYAPTPDIRDLVADDAMQLECARYVATTGERISNDTCVQLFTSLRQCMTLKSWCIENAELLRGIDVRRLITFGIIKGFLYRLHKYGFLTSDRRRSVKKKRSQAIKVDSHANTRTKTNGQLRNGRDARNGDDAGLKEDEVSLGDYLDGAHCFDEICTALGESEKQLQGRLKSYSGDVQIIQR